MRVNTRRTTKCTKPSRIPAKAASKCSDPPVTPPPLQGRNRDIHGQTPKKHKTFAVCSNKLRKREVNCDNSAILQMPIIKAQFEIETDMNAIPLLNNNSLVASGDENKRFGLITNTTDESKLFGKLDSEKREDIIDDVLINKIISVAHGPKQNGHRGINATVHAIDRHFKIPNLKKRVTEFIASCQKCQVLEHSHLHSNIPSTKRSASFKHTIRGNVRNVANDQEKHPRRQNDEFAVVHNMVEIPKNSKKKLGENRAK